MSWHTAFEHSENSACTTVHPVGLSPYALPVRHRRPQTSTLRRPQTTTPRSPYFLANSSWPESRNRHPRVPTLVICDWSLDWLLIGWCLFTFMFGPIDWLVSSSWFYFHPLGINLILIWSMWLSTLVTCHWIVVIVNMFWPNQKFCIILEFLSSKTNYFGGW